jgi:DNA-binding transcriptional regulator GbsR (MarR family)
MSEQASIVEVRSLSEFEQGVIDVFVRLADMLAMPRSIGEIYGLLFASAQPIVFQDIVDRLNMSKGSASQGLRVLRTTGAAKVVYVPGDRRDHFVPETELRALLSGFLREKIQPHLKAGSVRVDALRKVAARSARSPAEGAILSDRIEKLKAWHKRGNAIVPIITKVFG